MLSRYLSNIILRQWRRLRNKLNVRVASIEAELGMSVQNKAGIWCKPSVRMNLMIDGGTNESQRKAIIKQAFDEVCENIENLLEEM